MLICRSCNRPADKSRRDYGNTYVTFFYSHARPEGAELIHTWNVEADLARHVVEEDAARAKESCSMAGKRRTHCMKGHAMTRANRGRDGGCKICHAAYAKHWRARNREHWLLTLRIWRENHRAHRKAYLRNYYLAGKGMTVKRPSAQLRQLYTLIAAPPPAVVPAALEMP